MTTHWLCTGIPPRIPPCGAGGTYDQHATGGAAEKHTRDTGHGTLTSLSAEALARVCDRMGAPGTMVGGAR